MVRRGRLHLIRPVTGRTVLIRVAFDAVRDRRTDAGPRARTAFGCARLVTCRAVIGGEAGVVCRERLHLAVPWQVASPGTSPLRCCAESPDRRRQRPTRRQAYDKIWHDFHRSTLVVGRHRLQATLRRDRSGTAPGRQSGAGSAHRGCHLQAWPRVLGWGKVSPARRPALHSTAWGPSRPPWSQPSRPKNDENHHQRGNDREL